MPHSFHALAPSSLPSPWALSRDWPVCVWGWGEGGLEGTTWVLRWRERQRPIRGQRVWSTASSLVAVEIRHVFISSSHPLQVPVLSFKRLRREARRRRERGERGGGASGLEFLFAHLSVCTCVFACHVVCGKHPRDTEDVDPGQNTNAGADF